jgi:hypothetical protein
MLILLAFKNTKNQKNQNLKKKEKEKLRDQFET